MPPAPERALRRALARLAELGPDDAEAVLAELDPEQRRRAQALLGEARRGQIAPEDARWRQAGISPWLLDRMAGRGRPIAPAAQATLREAAAAAVRSGLPVPAESQSLLGRLWQLAGSRR